MSNMEVTYERHNYCILWINLPRCCGEIHWQYREKVRSMYSDMEVRRVFLSDALVEKWNEKYEDKISSFTEAMQDFARMGIDEVYIQPITLVADQCYQQMRKQALKFLHSNEYGFSQVNIGKPLLTSLGVKIMPMIMKQH